MSCYQKSAPIILALTFFLGCSGGDQSPTNSIGASGEKTSAEGGGGPSLNKPTSDPLHPVVLIETSLGNMTLRLNADKAPQTVDNFLAYIDAGHYDQTIIHQVFKGQGFLGGGYGVNLLEKPTRTPVRNEANNGEKNRRGTISMARLPDVIDSATCQFFINAADNPALDHQDDTPEGYGYCVFGEVTKGLEVVDMINNAEVCDTPEFERTPRPPIIITSIRRIQ